jgi:hypothetical protein
MQQAAPKSKSAQDEEGFDGMYADFAKNVLDLSTNLYSIATDVTQGEKADKEIANLPSVVRIVENWLLNLTSRPDLLAGYVKRVYVTKQKIDAGDGDALINDVEYFYGDAPFAQPYAPLFTRLWERHLNADEKDRATKFFKTFNAIAEDWIASGAWRLFDEAKRPFDRSVLARLERSLLRLDEVPEHELEASEEMAQHYKLLQQIRKEFVALRKKQPAVTLADVSRSSAAKTKSKAKTAGRGSGGASRGASAAASSVTVSRHGDHYDVDAVDVRVEQTGSSARVSTVKVRTEVPAPAAPAPAAAIAAASSSSSSSSASAAGPRRQAKK